jgi:hypothetical protein
VKCYLSILLLLCAALCGCAGKSKTKVQMQRAYEAGLQAGRIQAEQQTQPGVPQVRFFGHVKNPVVQWSDGMTLGQALVQAEYLDENTPTAITIYRNGQPLNIDPQRMLAGEDYPVFPGDTVVIQN